jgi:hypothetical protein
MRLSILVLHVSAGILAMFAGAFAISFRKGSRRHRTSGHVFVICMLIVSAAGAWLAFRKSEPDNVLGGMNAFYLVATAWATARRRATEMWAAEWSAPPIALLLAAIWITWALEVTRGRISAGQNSSAGGYFFFGVLAVLCAAGDVRMLLRGLSERQRLLRHLWRMCFGWFIATVSFFLGQQQVFPRWLRGSPVLVALAFLPLLLLVFWVTRVITSKTYEKVWIRDAAEASASGVARKT